jgi:hypothetical protein
VNAVNEDVNTRPDEEAPRPDAAADIEGPAEPREAVKVDADERSPEEAGYGYGV